MTLPTYPSGHPWWWHRHANNPPVEATRMMFADGSLSDLWGLIYTETP
jgi:hypothetical protein